MSKCKNQFIGVVPLYKLWCTFDCTLRKSFLSYLGSASKVNQHASSSAEWSLDKLTSSFVNGHELKMWDIVRTYESVRRHLFLQAPQLCSTEMIQQRPLLSRKAESRLRKWLWLTGRVVEKWQLNDSTETTLVEEGGKQVTEVIVVDR